MKVLLTGADGYLGSLAGPLLRNAGHDVVGLDTGYYRQGWLYHPGEDAPPVLTKDLRNIEMADLDGFDAIVHMAELSNDPLGQLHPGITHNINHKSSVRMAQMAKEVGVRKFVYMSSCSVYGVSEEDGHVDETGMTDPQTAYAECKMLVEGDLKKMADADFVPTYMRNATAYGASPRQRMDIVLNNLSGRAFVNKEIKMDSDGSPWRPIVHGLDICKAVKCALEAPDEAVHNEVFNVGATEHNYQVREIAEIVAAEFPGCQLSFGEAGQDNRSYKVSFEKIANKLPGYKSDWDAAAGAKQMRQVFEAVGFDQDDLEGRRYIRLNQLQFLIKTGQVDGDLFWQSPADVI